VQQAVAAQLAKLWDYVWGELLVEDLCRRIFGECAKKHRVSVLRALPYALEQDPRLEVTRGHKLGIRIKYDEWRAWRQCLMRKEKWIATRNARRMIGCDQPAPERGKSGQ
jgi:hypothetical protein